MKLMSLKTELILDMKHDREDWGDETVDDTLHDAAVAHALVKAMEGMRHTTEHDPGGNMLRNLVVDTVEHRATQILREEFGITD